MMGFATGFDCSFDDIMDIPSLLVASLLMLMHSSIIDAAPPIT